MGWLSFWLECGKRSFRFAFEATDLIMLVGPAALAAIAHSMGYEVVWQVPWWATTLLLIGALWLARFILIAPYQVWLAEAQRASDLDEYVKTLTTSPTPDWPIRELFAFIDPRTVTDDPNIRALWDDVGGRVLDKLATGQLHGWGRVDQGHRPLSAISTFFWERAEWTFFFASASPRANELVHVSSDREDKSIVETDFRDVQVNMLEATRLFESQKFRAER